MTAPPTDALRAQIRATLGLVRTLETLDQKRRYLLRSGENQLILRAHRNQMLARAREMQVEAEDLISEHEETTSVQETFDIVQAAIMEENEEDPDDDRG
jgi:hypothetical protein